MRQLDHIYENASPVSVSQSGLIRLSGPAQLKRDISTWLGANYFADVKPAV